jgi:hypothetical protein
MVLRQAKSFAPGTRKIQFRVFSILLTVTVVTIKHGATDLPNMPLCWQRLAESLIDDDY